MELASPLKKYYCSGSKRQPIHLWPCVLLLLSKGVSGNYYLIFLEFLHQVSVFLHSFRSPGTMAAEAPSWADQWGAGGIGAMEEDDGSKAKGDRSSDKKAGSKPGFAKAKAATVAGAKKIGSGISNGIKWIMNPRKKSSK